MKNQFIAHFREKDKKPQYLWDHLKETSELSGQFSEKIGLKESGEILGWFHDLGKASREFQDYICSAKGLIDPDADNYVDVDAKKGKVDHSSAGAQFIYRYLNNKGPEEALVAQILSLCLASHHSGLIDCLSPDGENVFHKRIEKSEEYTHISEALSILNEDEKEILEKLLENEILVKQLVQKLKLLKEDNDHKDTFTFKCGLLVRFLFSCLIDADRLNTADFEIPSNTLLRNNNQYQPWEILIQRLYDNKLKTFENKVNKNEVDDLRNLVSQSCLFFAEKPKGIYQLSVPTGGGKTLASLRFALHHTAKYRMDRIFYIIPFTSIIDQNADEIRKILEDKDEKGNYLDHIVLEHHSNLTPEKESRRHNLLSENWDAPIVFTTQVQFLESMFGLGTRSARRMHQLANAVIIFDEVQTIPIRCVHMFNLALRFLTHDCGSTVVLCTATQPLLDKIEPIQRALLIQPEQSMVAAEKDLFSKLRRVQVFDQRKIGGWNDEEVTELAEQELHEKGSVLIVVNTRKSARSLYQTLSRKILTNMYHLSTNMCPAHRLDVLAEVKKKLNKEPLICVSTQLIEAGVDVDFGAVIRYLAGLDSIAQAAGRCNRNGERQEPGNVWIVNSACENIEKLNDIQIGMETTQRVLDEFNDNPKVYENDRIGLSAMKTYYEYYFYQRKDEMRYRVSKNSQLGREDDLFNLLSLNEISVGEHLRKTNAAPDIPFKQSFQSASKAFFAIDSPARGVVVPYKAEGEKIVSDLCGASEIEKQYKLMKKARRYSVNLLPHEFKKMKDMIAIQEIQKGAGVFYMDDQYYSEYFGWLDEIVNEMRFRCE